MHLESERVKSLPGVDVVAKVRQLRGKYKELKSLEADVSGLEQSSALRAHAMTGSASLMRLLACLAAALVYAWQEQKEFSFSPTQLEVAAIGVGILALCLCMFSRGASRLQPPRPIAGVVSFIGRQTLAIYAIELVFFELLIKVIPALAP